MEQAQLNGRLAGWCVIYGVGMLFIGGRLFSRWYLYGSLRLDDWIMVAAAVAYTGSIIAEIFIFLAFRAIDLTAYIAVHQRGFLR